uniref:G-protein coupled receptors family 1 profile domain-containing protein n=1 Tax=Ciona savignyi TaxID=51511 RepID=H2YSK4_CIOSA
SSRYNLIDNWTLQVLVWVMAIVALLGNMVVAWNTVIELVKTWNSVLVLNLATSDLIMGIYLLWLGVMSFLYEGKTSINPYWSIDREWRTGATCNVLGTLLVVSSQTSVFILVALTSLRLYTVLKPFASYHLKFRYLFAICCLTWLFATFIAVAPIMPGDWQFFGYYSEDSVCMPKLYVTRKDRFWGHAASILILNFISVIYIAVSYFVIYYKSKQGHNVPRNQNIFMQRRIALLVATDCACWIPICIMGFI